MEIFFFVVLILGMLFGIGYAIYSFFTSPSTVERSNEVIGSAQNEGQFFDGADGYDATGGYQDSRD
ncbi:MAG: hypothetical protein RIR24_718 [Actinomycetota bacterium]|jgi:hypothetical protein